MTSEKRKASDSEQDIPRKQIISTDRQSCQCSFGSNDIYNVPPLSYNNVNEQQQLVAILPTKKEKKNDMFVDFIERLPFEIFCHIFELWRQIEVRYMPNLLHSTAIRVGGTKKQTQCYRIPSILVQHVEKLIFYDQISTYLNCTDFLRMHDFSNLVSLDLNISVVNGANIRSLELLYNTLTCVKRTLTDLRINWPRIQNTRISLLRILCLCQSLTSIKVVAWCIGDCIVPHKTLLSRMELHSTISIQPLFQLSSLLWHCPHLRYLEVNGCENDEEILPILSKCCPELVIIITRKLTQQQHFCNNDVNAILRQHKKRLSPFSLSTPEVTSIPDNTSSVFTSFQQQKKPLYQPGELQCLVLHNIHSVLPLQSRLEKSQNSLHTLSIAPMGGSDRDWNRLSTLSLPQLTFLHIKISNAFTEFLRDYLPVMLRKYHALETFVLEGSRHHSTVNNPTTATMTTDLQQDYVVADGIFNSISILPSLSSLRLSHLDIRGRAFGELLDRHRNTYIHPPRQQYYSIRSSSPHPLSELIFHHCIGVTSSILQNVSGIATLKKLSIYRPDQQVTVLEIAQLIRLQLHQLTCLELGLMHLTNESAEALASCRNLSTLLLYKMNGASRKRVDQLLRPHIKHVTVQWR
ncbi:hypothetical protein BDA99DRAFT_563819 [Phascolomyces articulosus]|uniref:Uncharacterized protein n=1 Tax=Phascolomyces articulosus TaxID=60185 RepID=A0AAD5JRC4_9FUNG|nr:hypothetical protein BDA99DRAFT_563819 [Phascolomyces articulosus]